MPTASARSDSRTSPMRCGNLVFVFNRRTRLAQSCWIKCITHDKFFFTLIAASMKSSHGRLCPLYGVELERQRCRGSNLDRRQAGYINEPPRLCMRFHLTDLRSAQPLQFFCYEAEILPRVPAVEAHRRMLKLRVCDFRSRTGQGRHNVPAKAGARPICNEAAGADAHVRRPGMCESEKPRRSPPPAIPPVQG
jgi:hypothetical protein